MRRRTFIESAVALAAVPLPALAARPHGPADLIVIGATVHTADDAAARAQAFAVRDGRFAVVGSFDAAMRLRGPRTTVLTLRGATVLPGLVDAHLHLTNVGLRLAKLDLSIAASFDEVVARTVAFARQSPDQWILGQGWDQHLWVGEASPTHDALTAALPDRPVVLWSFDGGSLLANARAMQLSGVDLERYRTGVFAGSAQALIDVPEPSHGQLVRALRRALAESNRWGLTTVAEPGVGDASLQAQAELMRAGEFTVRNYAMLWDDQDLIDRHIRNGVVNGAHDGHLWLRAINMFADAPRTGFVVTPADHMRATTEKALRAGFQVCTHATSEHGNRIVRDAYEAALATAPSADWRLRIVDGAGTSASSMNTLRRFHAAITDGRAPSRRLTREQALKSMTIWPAHQNFQDRQLGSISVGKYADFVVMDRDWMRVAADDVMQTRILATYLGGKRVHQGAGEVAAESHRNAGNACYCSQLAAVYEGRPA